MRRIIYIVFLLNFCLTTTRGFESSIPDTGVLSKGFRGQAQQQDSVSKGWGRLDSVPRIASGKLRLFPNPVSGILLIDIPDPVKGTVEIKVYDLTGKVLFTRLEKDPKGTISLDVSALPDGIYFLRLTADNRVYYHRFVCG